MWLLRRQPPILAVGAPALVCLLALLTGCGGAPPADAPSPTATPSAAATSSCSSRDRGSSPPRGSTSRSRRRSSAPCEAQPYDSGEDILVDLGAGRRADVVEVCSNESAERLARQGLLQPLDTSRIPQWDRLYPVLKDLPGVVVDGEVYMVPVTAAVTGILYDPAVDALAARLLPRPVQSPPQGPPGLRRRSCSGVPGRRPQPRPARPGRPRRRAGARGRDLPEALQEELPSRSGTTSTTWRAPSRAGA